MIVPLPGYALDLFLGLSLALSAATLLMTLSVRSVLEFSSFPSLLLFLTFFRLGLNIASVRLILSHGKAGAIIETFGKFVTGDSPIIGFVLFLLLTTINFIVITKGTGRIAEVSARFVLEALPGKQMAIDADVAANVITREEARRFRKQIEDKAEFYGAMDGASKFVRGEAIAALIITFVNICGGLGVAFSSKASVASFLMLAVGDGLVNQIPALLISLSAGLMVTRVSQESLSDLLSQQVKKHPNALIVAGIFLTSLGLIPGMPIFILLPMAALLFWGSFRLAKPKEEISFVSPLEIGLGLNQYQNKTLIENKLGLLNGQIQINLGISLPKIPIRLDSTLGKEKFQIKLKNISYCQEESELEIFFIRLKECIFDNAFQLLKRQDVQVLLEKARAIDAALIDELHTKKITPAILFKILQNLLKEGIGINDTMSIFEILVEQTSLEVDVLLEAVRVRLCRNVIEKLQSGSYLYAITLDPGVEEMVAIASSTKNLLLRPKTIENIEKSINEFLNKAKLQGVRPIILTSTKSRLPLCRLLDRYLPQLPIFSYKEVGDVKVQSLGTISDDTLI